MVDEQGSDEHADGLAGDPAATDGCGCGSTEVFRYAIGDDGQQRRLHRVQADEADAVGDADGQTGSRQADDPDGHAVQHCAAEDPRGTAAEAGTSPVGEGADEHGVEDGQDCAGRVDGAEGGVRLATPMSLSLCGIMMEAVM